MFIATRFKKDIETTHVSNRIVDMKYCLFLINSYWTIVALECGIAFYSTAR